MRAAALWAAGAGEMAPIREQQPAGRPVDRHSRLDELLRRSEAARALSSHTRARSRELRAKHRADVVAPLSARELEVLSMLSAGLPTKAIARELRISGNTVNYHLANIYRKLRVHSRVDASNAYMRILREHKLPRERTGI